MDLFLSWVMFSVKKVSFPAKTAVSKDHYFHRCQCLLHCKYCWYNQIHFPKTHYNHPDQSISQRLSSLLWISLNDTWTLGFTSVYIYPPPSFGFTVLYLSSSSSKPFHLICNLLILSSLLFFLWLSYFFPRILSKSPPICFSLFLDFYFAF